jgi:hypothetical protein
MKFFITFKVQNPEYSPKYAKEYNFGKESDGNWKDLWSVGYKLKDNIKEYKVVKDLYFELIQERQDKSTLKFQIPDVTKLICLTDTNKEIEIVVSNKLIAMIHVAQSPKYDTTRYYFYLKHDVDFIKLSEMIYLAQIDIPIDLESRSD